jgi:hypothetical protein
MITPADIPFTVYRHAAFPSVDPITLTDDLTGVPINITGATVTIQVRLYEGAAGDPLLSSTLAVTNGPAGQCAPPAFTEVDHEALVAAATADGQTLKATLKLRHDIKYAGVSNMPVNV